MQLYFNSVPQNPPCTLKGNTITQRILWIGNSRPPSHRYPIFSFFIIDLIINQRLGTHAIHASSTSYIADPMHLGRKFFIRMNTRPGMHGDVGDEFSFFLPCVQLGYAATRTILISSSYRVSFLPPQPVCTEEVDA